MVEIRDAFIKAYLYMGCIHTPVQEGGTRFGARQLAPFKAKRGAILILKSSLCLVPYHIVLYIHQFIFIYTFS